MKYGRIRPGSCRIPFERECDYEEKQEKKNDKKTDDEEIDAEVSYRKMPLKERIQKDYQLNKAVDVLNIIAKCSEKINQTKINDKSNEKGNE